MKNWVAHLITVQNLDMRLAALETKYRTIPLEKERLREEYRAVAEKVLALTAEIHKQEALVKEKETAVKELEEKIEKIRIHSATVKKNSEYQALMNEIASTHGKISDIETEQLCAIDAVEESKKALALAEEEKRAAERSAKTELQDLAETAEQIKKEALEVKKQRREFAGLCEPSVLEMYSRLREKDRMRKWIVPLNNGACANCALKITPQTLNEAKKGLVTTCDNCGSILYDPSAS
ncbi:MAG: hypothetical protein J6331_09920 [Lentisphaeria bacterium]|nr:hypothetical protein [Lentisphaeria bacterium]